MTKNVIIIKLQKKASKSEDSPTLNVFTTEIILIVNRFQLVIEEYKIYFPLRQIFFRKFQVRSIRTL